MAAGLNKKQQELLTGMSHETLVRIILELAEDNRQARSMLINGYLSSAVDIIKTIEKEYNRRTRSKRFYDYYEADALYDELTRTIAQPLVKVAATLPEPVEKLSARIMLEFEKFSENTDSSSGSWMDYYSVLLDAWMESIVAQKNTDPAVTAGKVFSFVARENYSGSELFTRYRALLGTDVLRALRDMYSLNKRPREALEISLLIRDDSFLAGALKKGEFCRPEHYFGYARLLMDDVRPEEAIQLLLHMEQQGEPQYADRTTWNELYITALTEDGRREDAMEKALSAFSFRCDTLFYQLYTKAAGKESDNLPLFLRIAEEKGMVAYLCFASDVERLDLADACITGSKKEELAGALSQLTGSFVRTLSSTLYKHGHALAATLLRHFLVEDAINRAQSKYYSYAASDMKKAIDYSSGLEESTQFEGTENYLKALYALHHRKTSLWPLMAGKIRGLSVGKDGIHYERFVE